MGSLHSQVTNASPSADGFAKRMVEFAAQIGTSACRGRSLFLGAVALGVVIVAPAYAAENATVKRFFSGTNRNSVGMVDAAEDTEIDAPQALYAADDGNLYLLDQVNGRILRFDAKHPSEEVQSLELPE